MTLVQKITRRLNFTIPNSPILDPDISSRLIDVVHVLQVQLVLDTRFKRKLKIEVPLIIAGFPYMLFEESLYRPVDALPLYEPGSTRHNTPDEPITPLSTEPFGTGSSTVSVESLSIMDGSSSQQPVSTEPFGMDGTGSSSQQPVSTEPFETGSSSQQPLSTEPFGMDESGSASQQNQGDQVNDIDSNSNNQKNLKENADDRHDKGKAFVKEP